MKPRAGATATSVGQQWHRWPSWPPAGELPRLKARFPALWVCGESEEDDEDEPDCDCEIILWFPGADFDFGTA